MIKFYLLKSLGHLNHKLLCYMSLSLKNPLAKKFQFYLVVNELKHLVLQFETRNVCLIELCYLIIEHVLEKNKIIQHL